MSATLPSNELEVAPRSMIGQLIWIAYELHLYLFFLQLREQFP